MGQFDAYRSQKKTNPIGIMAGGYGIEWYLSHTNPPPPPTKKLVLQSHPPHIPDLYYFGDDAPPIRSMYLSVL